jgi:hypothetical protein
VWSVFASRASEIAAAGRGGRLRPNVFDEVALHLFGGLATDLCHQYFEYYLINKQDSKLESLYHSSNCGVRVEKVGEVGEVGVHREHTCLYSIPSLLIGIQAGARSCLSCSGTAECYMLTLARVLSCHTGSDLSSKPEFFLGSTVVDMSLQGKTPAVVGSLDKGGIVVGRLDTGSEEETLAVGRKGREVLEGTVAVGYKR